jgi:hypothetical protein
MRGIDIGSIPQGVGLERLRFHPQTRKVIDLETLDEMYVEFKDGMFVLHCFPMEGTQKVTMRYLDRERLIMEPNGLIRLFTPQEWSQKREDYLDDIIDSKNLRQEAKSMVEDLTYIKIDNHIENVFGGLSSDQKESLKKLYKSVLYLAKKQIKK